MPQIEYQKQDLINIIHHLQAKVNFYKQQYEELQQREIFSQDYQDITKLGAYEKLQEENEKLRFDNEHLLEEIKKLQENEKKRSDSPFLHTKPISPRSKKTKQLMADAPQMDPWFMRNLKETNRLDNR